MSELFSALVSAFTQSYLVAGAAAFAWGLCSVIFSPCHLASIPLLVAYVNEQDAKTPRHAAGLSMLFALGILLTIAFTGAISAIAGHALEQAGAKGSFLVCAIFFLFGLDLLGVISIPWFGAKKEHVKSKGALGALVLGLLFGIAAGPCTIAFMAPILAATFYASTSNILLGIVLLLLFGLGHCAVLVLAGTFAERAQHLAQWNRETQTAKRVKSVLGTLLILTGLYLLYKA